MAERMAVAVDVGPERLGFPAAIDRCLRLQPGIDLEIVQHAIRLQRQQIRLGLALRVEERSVGERDVGHVEWP
jgi:hypothetical protein